MSVSHRRRSSAARAGNVFLIRIPEATDQKGGAESPSALIRRELVARNPGLSLELLREENIGAKVGKEIRNQAFLAILLAWGLLMVYVAFRFELWFGVGAVIAVIHDILMTLTLLPAAGAGDHDAGDRGPSDPRRLLDQRHDRRLRPDPRRDW